MGTHTFPHEGQTFSGRILRRVVKVQPVPGERRPKRLVHLNCGHSFWCERGMRMTVGKLTGCPECK
jgi:hypothetical protein